jgi:hypothetical protein
MGYTSADKTMVPDGFERMIEEMYQRCAISLPKVQIKRWYQDFGTYPKSVLRDACKRIGENDTRKITWRVIKDAISEVTPKRESAGTIGCTYCDSMGLIPYWKEINGRRYSFVARCHKCKTSEYINEPYYNEVFPDDEIRPHSTPEQMVCGKHIVEDVVKLITGREHADQSVERERSRQLYREKTL